MESIFERVFFFSQKQHIPLCCIDSKEALLSLLDSVKFYTFTKYGYHSHFNSEISLLSLLSDSSLRSELFGNSSRSCNGVKT